MYSVLPGDTSLPDSSIALKSPCTVSGITPGASGKPVMVYVFPDPVAP